MEVSASKVLLVSKHHKEQIIAPILSSIGIEIEVIENFDTDQFGTFAGEIPRIEGPKITVKEKCLQGLAHSNMRIGLASEGSFGAHPFVPFLKANEEWLCYIDLDRQIEIYAKSLATEISDDLLTSKDKDQLMAFLSKYDFPHQGMVFKDLTQNKIIQKGIQDQHVLFKLVSQFSNWQIETDLRAHQNPIRRKNIALAAQELVKRLTSLCPQCAHPDFWIKGYSGQLDCEWCGQATSSYRYQVYACDKCQHSEEIMRNDKKVEDPQYCQNCNP